jgi:acyl-CoA synthetase (NDP forming)
MVVARPSLFWPERQARVWRRAGWALHNAGAALPPVTDVDWGDRDRLRLAPLLAGYRGSRPGDRAAFVDVLRRVSALTEIAPEIIEMDLNPLRLLEPGRGAVAVDARIRVGKSGL